MSQGRSDKFDAANPIASSQHLVDQHDGSQQALNWRLLRGRRVERNALFMPLLPAAWADQDVRGRLW
jgi:hypothetical protein